MNSKYLLPQHKSASGGGFTQTDVEVSLSVVHLNIDLTLVDRLQLLLASPAENSKTGYMRSSSWDKVKHSLYMTSSNVHTIQLQRQAVFQQAMAADSSAHSRNHKLSFKISGDIINASLRCASSFPLFLSILLIIHY